MLTKLRDRFPLAEHRIYYADLLRLAEVKRAAADIAAAEPRVDVLLNNAGAMFAWRKITPDGFERTFALNHVAPFVLTHGLRERLFAAAPARVVNTAGALHHLATLHLEDLRLEHRYNAFYAYAHAKLCCVLFTRELARRWTGKRSHRQLRASRREWRRASATEPEGWSLMRSRSSTCSGVRPSEVRVESCDWRRRANMLELLAVIFTRRSWRVPTRKPRMTRMPSGCGRRPPDWSRCRTESLQQAQTCHIRHGQMRLGMADGALPSLAVPKQSVAADLLCSEDWKCPFLAIPRPC